MDRRDFLKKSSLFSVSILIPSFAKAAQYEKVLQLYHVHTGERRKVTFWLDGEYIPEEIESLQYFLRDFRNDEIHPIDIKVIEYLYDVSKKCSHDREIHVLSAYRSPSTNEYLRHHGGGVAKQSYHLFGKAIDFRIPGISLHHVRNTALSLHKGGVGYYPKSGFIHIDSGKPRSWRYPKS
ncbi:YcbK family protein [Nitratiruptor sp. SB155-2]|uniref:YcbK family protein n=1 Tax=Nitratiruptor sp. (strain SB155-2) TaxID=387092 RepID=UPI0001587339|nr:YcbK family protein [Nitratiruptor sp. SB155-2]BAF69853.1 conserved hypothetical protein [Nitratiruptor sp. SB155-2]